LIGKDHRASEHRAKPAAAADLINAGDPLGHRVVSLGR
jgi:hypothetical protein